MDSQTQFFRGTATLTKLGSFFMAVRSLPGKTADVELVMECIDRGEELVPVLKHPLLSKMSRFTVWRWMASGRVPTIRIGRSSFSTESLIRKSFVSVYPQPVKSSQADRANKARLAIDKI